MGRISVDVETIGFFTAFAASLFLAIVNVVFVLDEVVFLPSCSLSHGAGAGSIWIWKTDFLNSSCVGTVVLPCDVESFRSV